jgi:ABC-type branched-subunit amino acid transport system ATPase component/ABC-type branched-subunit amino acid transport system permease subunit
MTAGSLVLGLLNGAAFALLGLGIVLTYQTNRFLNLAYAQLGAAPALVLAKLVVQGGWSWWTAFPVSVAAGIGLGLLVEWGLVSRLRRRTRSTVSLLLLSVGVGQLLLALTYVPALGPPQSSLSVRGYPVPFDAHVTLGNVALDGADLMTCLLAPLVIVGLTAFLRFSLTGKKVRAAASNADAARLAGVSTSRVSLLMWGIAGGLSTITAVLQAPSQGTFNAATLGPTLLLLALGAATFGAFTSIPLTLAGGVALGVIQQVTLQITGKQGDAQVVLLLTILAVVVVRGRAIGEAFSVTGTGVAQPTPRPVPEILRAHWAVTRRSQIGCAAALLGAVLLPFLPALHAESRRFQLALITAYALVALSLCLLVGWTGQVSLGHFALVGLGAFVTARLADEHVSLLVIIALAGLAGAAAMVVVGLPALRVPGLSLAVTTLGLAVIAPSWLFRQSWVGTKDSFGITLDLPAPLRGLPAPTSELGVYFVGLTLLVATFLFLSGVRRTALGRSLLAVRDNETAAASFGLVPAGTKTLALALSGFVAGTAGVVWAGAWHAVAPTQFTSDVSLLLLAAPVIGGITSLAGSTAATAALFSMTFFLSPSLSGIFGDFGRQVGFQLALAGLGVVVTLLLYPTGMAGLGRRLYDRFLEAVATAQQRVTEAAAPYRDLPLVVEEARVAFGGVQALRGASIQVQKGEIVGLIGPNGAGKSTLMNVISGTVRPDSASVRVFGTQLIGLGREYRSALGVARSFQDASLFSGLTVREALQVAADRRHRVGLVSQALRLPWARTAELASRTEAEQVLERLGLQAWADTPTGELSTGTRRICDLAAQAVSRPAVLLLDEPTAGVAQRDAEAFGPLLRKLRDELECSILIIEHDMALLMGLCDRIYAMDGGQVLAEGTPEQVRSNPRVIASYLGTSTTAIDRSDDTAAAVSAAPRRRRASRQLIAQEEA